MELPLLCAFQSVNAGDGVGIVTLQVEELGFGTYRNWGLLYSHNGMVYSVFGFPAVRLSVVQPSMVYTVMFQISAEFFLT